MQELNNLIWWTDTNCLSSFFLKLIFVLLLPLCWQRIPNINDSIKEHMLHFVQSKTLSNDLEAIVASGACEIGCYIVIYVNIVWAADNFKYYRSPYLALRLDKLNKFSSFSQYSRWGGTSTTLKLCMKNFLWFVLKSF